ncbi:hypothetical protein MBUL_04489 (plasmid) [Methylobacterium bullatum]|uniref:Chromosome partition protein Smc n=1 Tax=Methylobacterium bullatum TaxID=570505 RepID=A0A679JC93_9HYPH|nr:hypothetical protein MBUL_04489 [Methylobacterium bullatum]
MNMLSSFFKRGPGEADASELEAALRAAEAERQTLREREQALAVERQDALLAGTDEDLDRIEAELVSVNRAAERHDLRIPELQRLHAERRTVEQRAIDKRAFDVAVSARTNLAEAIDDKLSDLGDLFAELEKTGDTLRGLNGYHGGLGKLNGPMAQFATDGDAVRMAIIQAAPSLARALHIEESGGRRKGSYRAFEDAAWAVITRGAALAVPTVEHRRVSEAEIEAMERHRQLSRRYQ